MLRVCVMMDCCTQLSLVFALLALVIYVQSASTGGHQPVKHNVAGVAGQSFTMACHQGAGNQLRDVMWSDRVYTSSHERAVIFRSANNPSHSIDADHPNKAAYSVDSDFRLTITRLDDEELRDAGDYYCDATGPGGAKHERHYYLTVTKTPECQANVTKKTMRPGEAVEISCKMFYASESHPTLKWFAGDQTLESKDEFEPGEAIRTVQVVLTPDDDRRPFRCETHMFEAINQCSVEFIVPHSVRQAQFVGAKHVYHAGEELRCTAKGSPDPDITLTPSLAQQANSATGTSKKTSRQAPTPPTQVPEKLPALPDGAEKAGPGWKSFIIPDSWIGRKLSVACEATNEVDRKRSTVSTRIDFEVIAAPKPVKGSASNNNGRLFQWTGVKLLLTSFFAVVMTSSKFNAMWRRSSC